MYQALYRKWRPKTFDDVVGQPQITETLKHQVETGRLSHAYLFIGTRGTGKTTCAKILAKAVNCEHPVDGNPCNACRSCLGIEDGSVMDVVELDAASNNGVDNVRALRDEAVFSPAEVKKRVYIVDEVHMLSIAAFNALLKILEEPPAHLMFILATTELQKVPATILSRCQRHSFRRLAPETVAARLAYVAEREGLDLQPEAAALLGRLADGAMRDGLSLLDQCAGAPVIDTEAVRQAMGLAGNLHTLELLRALRAGDTAGVLQRFAGLWQAGKDPATLLDELSMLLRDIMLLQVAGPRGAALGSGGYEEKTLAALADQIPGEELLWQLETIQAALAEMRSVQNTRTAAELCLVRLCEPVLAGGLSALEARVARLEQGRPVPAGEPVKAEPEHMAKVPAQPMEEPPSGESPESVPAIPGAEPVWEETPDHAAVPEPIPEPEPISEPSPTAEEAAPPKEAVCPPPGTEEDQWRNFLQLAQRELDASLYVLLSDDYHCRGRLADGVLELFAQNAFAKGILEKDSDRLRVLAERQVGRPVRLQFSEGGGPVAQASPIDELMRFENVTFT